MNKNPQVLSAAFKSAKFKLAKIEHLRITPEMDVEAKDDLVVRLAEIKALETETPIDNFISGQEWYVDNLIAFSGMTAQERLDHEYDEAFGDIASEEEMLSQLVG